MIERDSELRGELLEGVAALAELREPWQTLCDRCPWATPFQRHEWLLAWARQHRRQRPWTIVVYEREQLIGLAPLFLHSPRAGHGAGTLAFLGAGASDYCDLLALPGRERAVLHAMLATLASRRSQWDVCELDEQRPSISPLTRLGLPRGWSMQSSAQSLCPSLSLPARVDELDRHVPPRHLRRFENYRRRATRVGTLALERATLDTCERLLDTLFTLHHARWRARGEPGGFARAHVRALHRAAARSFAQQGALALYALHLDERAIACFYGFEHDRTLYNYLGGFDPAAASLNPGTLMLGLVIEESIRRGFTRFDFLRGAEGYKYWWGAEDRPTVRLRLTVDHAAAREVSQPASSLR